MSMIQSDLLLGQEGGAGYVVQRSVRFNASDSAYLSRVPSTAGNRKTWTFACWLKGSVFNSQNIISTTGTTNADFAHLYFNSEGQLTFGIYTATILRLSAVSRDPSAWFHIVLSFDSTQATAASRVKIYLNGVEQTSFSVDQRSTISQNTDYGINSTNTHAIGRQNQSGAGYLDGYLADLHLIDGQALTPSSFTEVSATTGQLIPKAYTGSFGTNGFWLKFSDNSAATATTLGKDYSGNNNNWTPNNLSVTAGAGNDSLTDTPTSYGTDTGAGGEVRGNYCTWNPISRRASSPRTVVNGNLDTTGDNNNYEAVLGTIAMPSGKWYWELTIGAVNLYNQTIVGIASTLPSNFAIGYGYYSDGGQKLQGGTSSSYGASFTTGDVVGIAFNADDGSITFYKNGASQGIAFTSIPSANYFPCVNGAGITTYSANFGQRPFAFPVSGFKALCDTNLPAPTIALPSTVMDVKLYTGNGSTQTISGLGFSPDLVWIKARGAAAAHNLYDIIRGTSKPLYSNLTNAEATNPSNYGVSAFNSDGFSVSDITDGNYSVNGAPGGVYSGAGAPYVAWAFDAGSNTVSNTAGSITSQVRANASAGFSIVTYTGTGSTATVGHGLGVAPALIITKPRSVGGTGWTTYHSALGRNKFLQLQATNAEASSTGVWGSAEPTSTVFGLGAADNNYSGATIVAYCFSPVAGYSSAFTYTGNGSSDGPMVWLGFRPRLILAKQSSASGANWYLIDSARGAYNVVDKLLNPNTSDSEETYSQVDFLSNGFKIRNTGTGMNANGATMIGFAWAESPFAYSRAR